MAGVGEELGRACMEAGKLLLKKGLGTEEERPGAGVPKEIRRGAAVEALKRPFTRCKSAEDLERIRGSLRRVTLN